MSEKLKVLAVSDPAVMGYVDEIEKILDNAPCQVEFDIFAWDKYYETMMKAFAGESVYDVVMVAGHLWKRDFIENNYIDVIDLENEDIIDSIIKEIYYKNNCYLSPSFCDGHMVVYRKSILNKVLGEDIPQIITPLKYIQIAEKLNDTGYKIAMKADKSEIFTDALPFLRMNGLDLYDDNGNLQSNRQEIILGLQKYCELKKYALKGTETFGNNEIAEKLKSGEAAMGITWSGQLGVVTDEGCLQKEDLGFARLTTSWNVTWSFAINNKSENKKTANEFLKFLRSSKIDEIAGRFSGAPVRENSYLSGQEKYQWYACQLEMIKNAKSLPDLLNAGTKNSVFYDKIAQAFSAKLTPEDAMLQAYEKINAIKDEI